MDVNADLSKSFWMIDSWAWLARGPQISCFSPILYVLRYIEYVLDST